MDGYKDGQALACRKLLLPSRNAHSAERACIFNGKRGIGKTPGSGCLSPMGTKDPLSCVFFFSTPKVRGPIYIFYYSRPVSVKSSGLAKASIMFGRLKEELPT